MFGARDGDDATRQQQQTQQTTTPHEQDSHGPYEHERAFAGDGADDQQPLLESSSSERTDIAPPASSADSSATRASAAGARILHAALPQLSQWLQDVNSHTQLQMHGLRHQGSSGGGGGSASVLDDGAAMTATGEDADDAAHHLVDVRSLSDHDADNRRSESFSPQSRHRGGPQPRSVASLPPSSSSSSHQRGPLFEEDAGSDANAAPMLFTHAAHVHRVEESHENGIDNDLPPAQDPATAPATGRTTTTAAAATGAAHDNSDDQSAVDELHALFRRCHHSLPFVALFIIYFAYQHTTGIVVFFVGTVAIMGLDQRTRTQIALKEKASALHLVGIVAMCAVDMFALCCVDGDPNPLRHFAKTFRGDTVHEDGVFWDVLWTVVVNDFIIRLCSVAVKAVVAVVKSDSVFLSWRRKSERGVIAPVTSPRSSGAGSSAASDPYMEHDLESQSMAPSQARAPSSITFYRRKLCSSKFIADTFTFGYILIKALILGTQGRKIVSLVRSFVTLGLEFGVYVSHEDLVEAGSPDCSICYEEMHQPVKLSCSHMFCEECVMEWFDRERSCPLCRANMAATSERGGEQDEVKPQFLDGSTSLFPQLF